MDLKALNRLFYLHHTEIIPPENRPVADFLPTISITAKTLAAEMTGLNVESKDLTGLNPIEKEHIDNNQAVRNITHFASTF